MAFWSPVSIPTKTSAVQLSKLGFFCREDWRGQGLVRCGLPTVGMSLIAHGKSSAGGELKMIPQAGRVVAQRMWTTQGFLSTPVQPRFGVAETVLV